MPEIVPAINAETFEEVSRRLQIAEGKVKSVQIDVSDGSFTPNISWHNASDLKTVSTNLEIEIHLMATAPEDKIDPWLKTQAEIIIVHYESTPNIEPVLKKIRDSGKKAGLAIRPDTPWNVLVPFLDTADLFLMLAVSPGPSGQAFDRVTIEKISQLHAAAPSISIEVDGGIKMGIAKECAHAGADRIVVGSALYGKEHAFDETLKEFEADIRI